MELLRKIQAVKTLHAKLDARTGEFALAAGLSCPQSCGACCSNPAIDASVLDVLPLAQEIIDTGSSEELLQKLRQWDGPDCFFFRASGHGQGFCSQYASRPSLCRLFGYAGRIGKRGQKEAVPCRVLKTTLEEKLQQNPGLADKLPIFGEARTALEAIDPHLATMTPLPQALIAALEKLLLERRLADGASV